jgi:hypothetical protein
MVGQFDIIPLFLVIFSIWAYLNNRKTLGVISLGLGGGLKMFPLFFVLPFSFLSAKSLFKRLWLIILGVGFYFLTILPFLSSSVFRRSVLFSNQSQKMLFAQMPVSGAEGVYVFIFIFITWLSFYESQRSVSRLCSYYLAILLSFFSVTHFRPQWFLWVTPFLIFILVQNMKTFPVVLLILFSWLGITLLFEPSLSVGLFAPVNPGLSQSRGLANMMPPAFDAFKAKSILRSILAGSSLFLIVYNMKQEDQ